VASALWTALLHFFIALLTLQDMYMVVQYMHLPRTPRRICTNLLLGSLFKFLRNHFDPVSKADHAAPGTETPFNKL
jgi:hypothetical protein